MNVGLREPRAAVALAVMILLFCSGAWFSSEIPHSAAHYQTNAASNSAFTNYDYVSLLWHPIQTFWSWTTQDVIGFYTFVLSISTFLLFVVSTIQIRFLIRADRNTGEQIKLAREEFTSTYRPKLRIKHFWLDRDIWQDEAIVVNLVCVNCGATDAIFQEIGIKYYIVNAARDIPIEPNIPALPITVGGTRIQSGLNYKFLELKEGTVITPDQNIAIQRETAKLYCVGYVSYVDQAERMRITGFCRVLTFPKMASVNRSTGSCRFRVHDDPDYEYQD